MNQLPREKMSKSRNNVVTPDEVIYGVYELSRGFEFRTIDGVIHCHRTFGIWQNKGGDGYYYTSTRSGRIPVFLCQCGDPRPCVLLIDGHERVQHPELLDTLPD